MTISGKKRSSLAGLLIAIFLLVGGYYWVSQDRLIVLNGQSMGTSYTIKAYAPRFVTQDQLEKRVTSFLYRFNKVFSTYDAQSDIMDFNASELGLEVKPEFASLVVLGQQLYEWTYGAWDATVQPLVELWGFGKDKKDPSPPSDKQIQAVLKQIGYHHVQLEGSVLTKKHPKVSLDFSSMAKGYAVDKLAYMLDQNPSIKAYFIEIGGEIYTKGQKPNGQAWLVGINTPAANASQTDIFKVIALQNKALATSGDYREFFTHDGETFTHILNPKTGYPIKHNIVSVSVIAPQCAIADGLATALMVMGRRNGLSLINRLDNIEAMVITQEASGLQVYYSSGFPQ